MAGVSISNIESKFTPDNKSMECVLLQLTEEFPSDDESGISPVISVNMGEILPIYENRFITKIKLFNYLYDLNPFNEGSDNYNRFMDLISEHLEYLHMIVSDNINVYPLTDKDRKEYDVMLFGESFTDRLRQKEIDEGIDSEKSINRKKSRIKAILRGISYSDDPLYGGNCRKTVLVWHSS